MIALDWGTTSLRAYRLDHSGAVLDSMSGPFGILQVPNGDFNAALQRFIGSWLVDSRTVPIVSAGMIGSRQGWRETPYVTCPAAAVDIARALSFVSTDTGRRIWLTPGVSFEDAAGIPDVIRGEETQIVGELITDASPRRLFILPGTHSKWLLVEADHIVWFATFMSGELFALLCEHSILRRLMAGHADQPEAFRRGLDFAALEDDRQGGLLKRLFSARTLGLFDRIPASGIHSYLSGLIIGTEISEGFRCLNHTTGTEPVTVVGDGALAELYLRALRQRDIDCRCGAPYAVAAGLWRIAGEAGLLEQQ